MDGGLRNEERILPGTGVCEEVSREDGAVAVNGGGHHRFGSVRGSGQHVLEASNNVVVGVISDAIRAHDAGSLLSRAATVARSARAIVERHDAVSSRAGAMVDSHDFAEVASHAEAEAFSAGDMAVPVALTLSVSDEANAGDSRLGAGLSSVYTMAHILPTSEPDLLGFLCGRTIAQGNAGVGESGFDACIAQRSVLSSYFAAVEGGMEAVRAALQQVGRQTQAG